MQALVANMDISRSQEQFWTLVILEFGCNTIFIGNLKFRNLQT